MKSENNGKIAVAIVAMFVVALSIVGFTYAYFTAQVKGNTADKSVDVVAGKLVIKYAQTKKLEAQNVLPGWVSDSKHYYDPSASRYDTGEKDENQNAIIGLSAITDDAKFTNDTFPRTAGFTPAAKDGITDPVAFTVENDTDNAGDNTYVIQLIDIANGINDKENFVYTLYDGNTVVNSGSLNASGTQIISGVQTLAKTAPAKTYTVKFGYKNVSNQDASKTKTVTATVKVMPVVKNAGGTWVDADNATVNGLGTNGELTGGSTTDNFATWAER